MSAPAQPIAAPVRMPMPPVRIDPKILAADFRALQDQVQYQSLTGGAL